MFTPQQIEEKTFVKAVFGGYDMQSVDEFLGPLTEDYVVLYKENSVLKSKMKVLVEKLEEYRAQEDSLRKAILAAQQTADSMIAATQKQCARMLNDAQKTLEGQNADLKKQIRGEEARLKAVRAAVQEYITKLEVELEEMKTRQMVEGPGTKAYDFEAEPDPRSVEVARTIKRSLEKRVEEEKAGPGEVSSKSEISRPAPAPVQQSGPLEATTVWKPADAGNSPSSPTVVIPDLGDFMDQLTADQPAPAPEAAAEPPAEETPAAEAEPAADTGDLTGTADAADAGGTEEPAAADAAAPDALAQQPGIAEENAARKNGRSAAAVGVSEDTLARFADLQFGRNYNPTTR